MNDEYPCYLEDTIGIYEIDRDQRGLQGVFEVYETIPVESTGWWYEQPRRGRLMFRVVADSRHGQDPFSEATKQLHRRIGVPEGLSHQERWRHIHRAIDKICADAEKYGRSSGQ